MPKTDIIKKIKQSGLIGRSGSCFPTWSKWEIVKNAKADKKYIICNGSEGEPYIEKDGYLLKAYPEEVINGIKLALKAIPKSTAIIYLRHDYYNKLHKVLKKHIKNAQIELFKKHGGYLAGEETVVCENIEGNRLEPRIKPPFPGEKGLYGKPTLINNVETFYSVSKIAKDEYYNTRFYTITGDVKYKGIYELPENWSIKKILEQTNNYPKFDFFVQNGGGATGEILLPKELKQKVSGSGGIIVFNKKKTNIHKLLKSWVDYYLAENCDKCTPCREGIYRVAEMVYNKKINKKELNNIFNVLQETSFCALGRGFVLPFRSLIKKIGYE